MKILPSSLPEILIIEPSVFQDERGFFMETYQQRRYTEAGIESIFVQDNLSRSVLHPEWFALSSKARAGKVDTGNRGYHF